MKSRSYKRVTTPIAVLIGSLLRGGIPTNSAGFGLTAKNPPTQQQLGCEHLHAARHARNTSRNTEHAQSHKFPTFAPVALVYLEP